MERQRNQWEWRDQGEKHFASPSGILVCAPEIAFERVSVAYMRQWYLWMPGTLLRYGYIPERSEIYLGGLTTCKSQFVLVPRDIFEQQRRVVLLQIAKRIFLDAEPLTLTSYCEQEIETLDTPYCASASLSAREAETQVRKVAYWVAFLAHGNVGQATHSCWQNGEKHKW
jgi:hypothetical protein